MVLPFVLCGGVGTCVLPHRLIGPHSLFQQTCERLSGDTFGSLLILSSNQHRFFIQEQLQEIGLAGTKIVLEPISRSTAPAACVAALMAARVDIDSLVLFAPSDHAIGENSSFVESVNLGVEAAASGALVTFGVEPNCPHTGYGYIETNPRGEIGNAAISVKYFVEKPSRKVPEGGFYRDTGILLFGAATMVELFQRHEPETLSACRSALNEATKDLGFTQLGESYRKAPSISLDYAIMEKADNIACVPLTTS